MLVNKNIVSLRVEHPVFDKCRTSGGWSWVYRWGRRV